GLGDEVAAVGLRPRARLGDRGEGEVEVLRRGRLEGDRVGERRGRVAAAGAGHGRVLQSRNSPSGTSGRLTTMFSGVRQVIQTSGRPRSRLHSICGMNGGTKTQSPAPKS